MSGELSDRDKASMALRLVNVVTNLSPRMVHLAEGTVPRDLVQILRIFARDMNEMADELEEKNG